MRKPTAHLAAIVLLLCTACSSTNTWQTTGEITPLSYRRTNEGVTQSVCKLRLLVILPIRVEYLKDGKRVADLEAHVVENLSSRAFTILSAQKGYEVMPFDLYNDVLRDRLNVSSEELHRYVDLLMRWAKESPDGAPPPVEIADIARRVGRALNADGLVLVHELIHLPSTWNEILCLLTASVSWPLLLTESYFEEGVDLFEVATGRIVWRNHRTGTDFSLMDHPERKSHFVGNLFQPLEQALPRALIKE